MTRFQVTARGELIEYYNLPVPAIRIVRSGLYEEMEARALAGLTVEEYDRLPGDPIWITEQTAQVSKAHIVAYSRMASRIRAVSDDAEIKKRS